jgi:hypothetical protein
MFNKGDILKCKLDGFNNKWKITGIEKKQKEYYLTLLVNGKIGTSTNFSMVFVHEEFKKDRKKNSNIVFVSKEGG